MSARQIEVASDADSTRWFRRVAAITALAVCVPWCASRTVAADALKDDSSLSFAPADVSFYLSGMRMREVFDKVAASNAIAKLKAIPSIQFGWAMAMQQWQNPQNPQLAMFKQMLADPANQQLVELLIDAVSHDELNMASSAGQMEAISAGDFGNLQAYQVRKMLEVVDKQGDKLKVPSLVKGMKLSDSQRAVDQLLRLEQLAQSVLAQNPELQPRFKREQVGGTDYLTLRLDGNLIPWPMLEGEFEGIDPQDMQKLVEKLKAIQLVISIGVRDKYLLVSIGSDNKHLATLGQGKLLYDREEMAPLRKAADKPITQVSFVSADFLKQVGAIDRQMDQVVMVVKQFAPLMLATAPELQQEFIADVESLGQYVKDNMPATANHSGYHFLTPAGIESYGYNWTTESPLDATKDLAILNHVGGDPIAFYAARGKPDPQGFEHLSTFVARLAYYAEQFGLQQMDEDQQASYEKLKTEFLPLVKQLETVTRDKLIPAFADGQGAYVLDAKSTSESWFAAMPPAEGELPMLELAMVIGVSDAKLVKEAFGEYFDILQKALDQLHEASTGDLRDMFPNPIGPIKLAKPQTRDTGAGTVYFYTLPEESGLDAQLAPNAGLSDKVMVTSLLPRFTARLLAETPVQNRGPLASTNGPLAAAFQLQFAALLDAISPWVDYGMGLTMAVSLEAQPDAGPMGNIPQQVHDVIDVLKCFRGVSGVVYLEDKAMVTHSQWQFEDLQ